MNPWTFIGAAYAVALAAMAALALTSFLAMRRAERRGPNDIGR